MSKRFNPAYQEQYRQWQGYWEGQEVPQQEDVPDIRARLGHLFGLGAGALWSAGPALAPPALGTARLELTASTDLLASALQASSKRQPMQKSLLLSLLADPAVHLLSLCTAHLWQALNSTLLRSLGPPQARQGAAWPQAQRQRHPQPARQRQRLLSSRRAPALLLAATCILRKLAYSGVLSSTTSDHCSQRQQLASQRQTLWHSGCSRAAMEPTEAAGESSSAC